jgi:hypothetical protein
MNTHLYSIKKSLLAPQEHRFAKTGLIVLLVALLLGVGCGKRFTYKWVYYDETYCSDVWKTSANNETLKQNVIDYLDAKGVKVFDIEIFSDKTAESFVSCDNRTGRRFKCKIKEINLSKVKGLGFYE